MPGSLPRGAAIAEWGLHPIFHTSPLVDGGPTVGRLPTPPSGEPRPESAARSLVSRGHRHFACDTTRVRRVSVVHLQDFPLRVSCYSSRRSDSSCFKGDVMCCSPTRPRLAGCSAMRKRSADWRTALTDSRAGKPRRGMLGADGSLRQWRLGDSPHSRDPDRVSTCCGACSTFGDRPRTVLTPDLRREDVRDVHSTHPGGPPTRTRLARWQARDR
jgi:hypothetical protein